MEGQSPPELIDFAQQVLIAFTVGHKLEAVRNAGRGIFGMMGNEQQLRFTFANQDIHKTADQLAV